jgi:multidrug efflux pump subunit AcrA (membrane-fusion protein)
MAGGPQISLRSLLLGGVALGAAAGVFGPGLTRLARTWLAPRAAPPAQVALPEVAPWDEQTTGYFESAETPLR